MLPWDKFKSLFGGADTPPTATQTLGLKRQGAEKRYTVRRNQRLAQGYIWSEHMAASKPCTIRNISATGARIDLLMSGVKMHVTAGMVTLFFSGERQEVECEVMWRSGRSLGLRFASPFRAPTRRYGV